MKIVNVMVVLAMGMTMSSTHVRAEPVKALEKTAAAEKSAEKPKARKKKVEICGGCGKPENNCDCDHAKKH